MVVILMNRTEYVSHRKLVMSTYHVARPVSTVYKTSESMMSFILCEISLYQKFQLKLARLGATTHVENPDLLLRR